MAEEKEDPQKLKRIAAATYGYDSDARWADYWSNILIPPHMASRSDVVDHYKRKFYQRFIDPELFVEPMSSGSSSQPARQSATSTSSSAATGGQARPQSSGSFSRSAVNFMAGCNTAVSNIVMSCVVLLTLELITPLCKYTPNAILASIIISAVVGLINIDAAILIWKIDKLDFIACMGAFFGVVFISVEIGLLLSRSLSPSRKSSCK